MMTAPDTSLYLGPEVILTMRSALGHTEDWEPMAPSQVRNTWNGEAKMIRPTFRRKSTIRLSASGNGVWRHPSFEMLQPGHPLTLHSCQWKTDLLPAGELSKTLLWAPVPGLVRLLDPATDQVFPLSVDGKTVSSSVAFEKPMAISFKPIVEVLLGDFSPTGDSKTGLATWTVDLHMRSAP